MTPPHTAPAPVRWLTQVLLAAYFHRIDRFRPERIPGAGPLLVVANHPGSLTDALVIGASVERPVHFVASVQLFRSKPVAWLLSHCGVIPINRRQDDPTKMATVAQTFDACGAVLESGGAVGLFPEGVSYDDSHLKEVKTGAARLSLGLEGQHHGALGLQILPVGLTYSAKERFRSRVLVHFGEPIAVRTWLAGGEDEFRANVRTLTHEIDQQIRTLILDIPTMDHERIVVSVRGLYLDTLRTANLIVTEPMSEDAETLVLTQAIARALNHFATAEPARLAAFTRDLDRYETWLKKLGLSDRAVQRAATPRRWFDRVATGVFLIVMAPLALFGWVHHLIPAVVVGWSVEKFTPAGRRKSQVPLTVMLSGAVAISVCYAAYIAGMYAWKGAQAALLYGAILPISGLVGHAYLGTLQWLGGRWRAAGVFLQGPIARRTLVALRARLIATIESFRTDYAKTLVPELRELH